MALPNKRLKLAIQLLADAMALPNKRLKLTAPVVCGRIAFVNTSVRRRSLGAIR